MNAVYITPDRYDSVVTLPISLAETELRRGSIIQASVFYLKPAQRASVRVLTLSVLKMLTPGVVPDEVNSTCGVVTAGIYGPLVSRNGHMPCSPVIKLASSGIGTAFLNPYCDHAIVTPGIYVVQVFNNTGKIYSTAVDVTVCLTGSIKFYS